MARCALSRCKNKQLGVTCKQCYHGVDGQGDPIQTSYCSMHCLKVDQNAHKRDCKAAVARKYLYRAATAAHQIFLDYRLLAFERPTTAVGVDGWDFFLKITEDFTVKEEDIFHDFPGELTNDTLGETAAVLAYGASHESIQITKRLLLWALEDKCSYLLAVKQKYIWEEGFVRNVVINGHANSFFELPANRWILVKLKDIDETYVIDIGGAHLRDFKLVRPISEVPQARLNAALDIMELAKFPDSPEEALREGKAARTKWSWTGSPRGWDWRLTAQNRLFKCVDETVRTWLDNDSKETPYLSGDLATYNAQTLDLRKVVGDAVNERVQQLKANPAELRKRPLDWKSAEAIPNQLEEFLQKNLSVGRNFSRE